MLNMRFKEHFNNTKKLLVESEEMLDVSILNIDKAKSKITSLLNESVTITEKTDGVKATIVRNDKAYSKNWTDNWIVAYKGNIIYPEEFEGVDVETNKASKSNSIGITQFNVIFDVLKTAHLNKDIKQIPLNTEFFCEFLMRKPTLTREYTLLHNLILLAVSPTTYKESFGRLVTRPEAFNIQDRNKFAKILNVDTPKILFKGTIQDITSSTDPNIIIDTLKNKFLTMQSSYGGLMEGVVLEFENGLFLKILQSDQHDKTKRTSIKHKHAPLDQNTYFNSIRALAEQAVNSIKITNVTSSLKQLSHWIFSSANHHLFENLDPNKAPINAKDDTLLTAKSILLRKIPGNNNALFIGRMSPLTIAHYNIIQKALSNFDKVAVNLVKSKINERNPFPVETQIKMLRKCFNESIEITTSETGNLIRVLQKPSFTINTVIAGSDRINDYQQQLLDNKDVTVLEIPRIDDVSGTKVRIALLKNDESTFKKNTPNQIWDMFEELKQFVKSAF